MKKIVVFGASGDVGRYFIDYLLQRNEEYDIYAVGRRKKFTIFDKYHNVHYLPLDIQCDQSEFMRLPQDIYAIVDFAGVMPARMKGYHPQQYIDVNITGTLNILEYARKAHADRILFMQSFGDIKDYGDTEVLLTAHMPRKFKFNTDHTVYVMSKNFAVDLLENYHQMYGIKNFIFRLPTIYLYSETDSFYVDGVKRQLGYRKLIDMAMHGETMQVWGNPERVKDMVYVKDFCQMLSLALKVNRPSGYYNVGTGVGISLLDQIKGIIKVFGQNNGIEFCPDKPNAPQYIMDITPARLELGYKPQYDYLTSLKDFKEEMLSNRLYREG
jgi:UDP-glucose 4-epimerase